MYIGDYLGRREIYSPDKLAIIDAGKDPELRLTYQQWNERVNRLANWLKERSESVRVIGLRSWLGMASNTWICFTLAANSGLFTLP